MIGLCDITFFSIEGTALSPETVAVIRAKTERKLEAHFSSLSSPSPDELAKQRHLGELLDDGLKLTFAASDPGGALHRGTAHQPSGAVRHHEMGDLAHSRGFLLTQMLAGGIAAPSQAPEGAIRGCAFFAGEGMPA